MSTDLDSRWAALFASGGARWCPGMRWAWDSNPGLPPTLGRVTETSPHVPPGAAPDWTDPATLGALLGLVREAWGDEAIHCAPALYDSYWSPAAFAGKVSHWHCYASRAYNPITDPKPCAVTGPTEAAALLAALEAARERR